MNSFMPENNSAMLEPAIEDPCGVWRHALFALSGHCGARLLLNFGSHG